MKAARIRRKTCSS